MLIMDSGPENSQFNSGDVDSRCFFLNFWSSKDQSQETGNFKQFNILLLFI